MATILCDIDFIRTNLCRTLHTVFVVVSLLSASFACVVECVAVCVRLLGVNVFSEKLIIDTVQCPPARVSLPACARCSCVYVRGLQASSLFHSRREVLCDCRARNACDGLVEVVEKLGAHGWTRLDRDDDPALVYILVGFFQGVLDPHAFGVGVPHWQEDLVSCRVLVKQDGCDLTLSAILEMEVQCVDDWECPESRSSRRSIFVDLELDRACERMAVQNSSYTGFCRLEDLERFESKTEPGVGSGYRAEDFVAFVVTVEPAPDGVQEVELASRQWVRVQMVIQRAMCKLWFEAEAII